MRLRTRRGTVAILADEWPRQRSALITFWLSSVCGARFISKSIRPLLWRASGITIGDSYIESGVAVVGGRRLTIGDGSYVNADCLLDVVGGIRIGNFVSIGHRVSIISSTHVMGSARQRAGDVTSAAVTIGNGVWVGAGAVILPGVTLGAGCVVAAGAVVTRSIAPDQLVGGVPARALRALDREGVS